MKIMINTFYCISVKVYLEWHFFLLQICSFMYKTRNIICFRQYFPMQSIIFDLFLFSWTIFCPFLYIKAWCYICVKKKKNNDVCLYSAFINLWGRLQALFWQSFLICSLFIHLRPPSGAILVGSHCGAHTNLQEHMSHGTSDYSGIRISHVFCQGIEPGSTAWKSRALTTQPQPHMLVCLELPFTINVRLIIALDE